MKRCQIGWTLQSEEIRQFLQRRHKTIVSPAQNKRLDAQQGNAAMNSGAWDV